MKTWHFGHSLVHISSKKWPRLSSFYQNSSALSETYRGRGQAAHRGGDKRFLWMFLVIQVILYIVYIVIQGRLHKGNQTSFKILEDVWPLIWETSLVLEEASRSSCLRFNLPGITRTIQRAFELALRGHNEAECFDNPGVVSRSCCLARQCVGGAP